MTWLTTMQKTQPARLVRNIKAVLAVLSLLGYVGLTQAQIDVLGVNLEIILPLLGAILWPAVEWVATKWLHARVSPEATTKPMAEAIKTITAEHPELVQPAARKAAARVLDASLK